MADIETLPATKRTHAEGAAAATPSAGEVVFYAKTDGLMYSKDDAGTETLMSSGAALSNPMTTAEDVIKGGASGTPARLALGASNTFLGSSNSTLAYVGLGVTAQAPDSVNANAAPTASNDFTQGWRRGSTWITAAGDIYMLADELTGAASWKQINSGSGDVTATETRLTSDVSLANANTYYDGPSASLSAGTYLVTAKVYVINTTGGGTWQTSKLWDGSTAYDSNEFYQATNNGGHCMEHMKVITLGGTTTVKVSVAQTAAGGSIKASVTQNATGQTNMASVLVAVKLA